MEIESLFKRVHWENEEVMQNLRQRKEDEEEECPVSIWLQALDGFPALIYRYIYIYMHIYLNTQICPSWLSWRSSILLLSYYCTICQVHDRCELFDRKWWECKDLSVEVISCMESCKREGSKTRVGNGEWRDAKGIIRIKWSEEKIKRSGTELHRVLIVKGGYMYFLSCEIEGRQVWKMRGHQWCVQCDGG